jgi:hypothetical protein
LIAVLIPAAIALAGHFIAQGISRAEIASEERQAAQSRIVAEANTRIGQAELLNTFMQSLTSDNANERKIAIDAILIAMPDQGPAIVRGVARYDDDESVQEKAEASINDRLSRLVEALFAAEAAVRQQAAQELIQGWRTVPELIPALIAYARNHPANENGVYNTVVVFNALGRGPLMAHRDEVMAFLDEAKAIGPRTRRLAEEVEGQL